MTVAFVLPHGSVASFTAHRHITPKSLRYAFAVRRCEYTTRTRCRGCLPYLWFAFYFVTAPLPPPWCAAYLNCAVSPFWTYWFPSAVGFVSTPARATCRLSPAYLRYWTRSRSPNRHARLRLFVRFTFRVRCRIPLPPLLSGFAAAAQRVTLAPVCVPIMVRARNTNILRIVCVPIVAFLGFRLHAVFAVLFPDATSTGHARADSTGCGLRARLPLPFLRAEPPSFLWNAFPAGLLNTAAVCALYAVGFTRLRGVTTYLPAINKRAIPFTMVWLNHLHRL